MCILAAVSRGYRGVVVPVPPLDDLVRMPVATRAQIPRTYYSSIGSWPVTARSGVQLRDVDEFSCPSGVRDEIGSQTVDGKSSENRKCFFSSFLFFFFFGNTHTLTQGMEKLIHHHRARSSGVTRWFEGSRYSSEESAHPHVRSIRWGKRGIDKEKWQL